MNNSDAYTYILNNILEYKQMIIDNSLWIYSFAKFEKIDENDNFNLIAKIGYASAHQKWIVSLWR